MSLNQRIHEQLAEIGIDDSETIPDQEVVPESNDISWVAQKAVLLSRLDETEKAALSNVIAHPLYADVPPDHPNYTEIKQGLAASERVLLTIIGQNWPRRAE